MTEEIPFPVPPLSWLEIDRRVQDYLLHEMPEVLETPRRTDVERLIEVCFSRTHDIGVRYDHELMPAIEAQLDPFTRIVHVGTQTELGIYHDRPRARFTYSHEAGHVLLHMQFIIENCQRLARLSPTRVESYYQPEPQANQAAAAFLLPKATVVPEFKRLASLGWSEWEITSFLQNLYGCSDRTVELRLQWLNKEGFLR